MPDQIAQVHSKEELNQAQMPSDPSWKKHDLEDVVENDDEKDNSGK
ncbi:MAG: hypothetical protein ACR2JB_13380 [Bryobacteraceae bacterium]